MIVLGVDPSFTATGFAILQQQGNKQLLKHYGYLSLSSTKSMPERIGIFHQTFKQMIIQHQITRLSIETPFLGKNAQTFLKLGYLRGVLHLLAYQHNIEIYELTPREVKLAVTGFGGAQKDQVSRMVHLLFPVLSYQKSHDITDAIAVGLCALWGKNDNIAKK